MSKTIELCRDPVDILEFQVFQDLKESREHLVLQVYQEVRQLRGFLVHQVPKEKTVYLDSLEKRGKEVFLDYLDLQAR